MLDRPPRYHHPNGGGQLDHDDYRSGHFGLSPPSLQGSASHVCLQGLGNGALSAAVPVFVHEASVAKSSRNTEAVGDNSSIIGLSLDSMVIHRLKMTEQLKSCGT